MFLNDEPGINATKLFNLLLLDLVLFKMKSNLFGRSKINGLEYWERWLTRVRWARQPHIRVCCKHKDNRQCPRESQRLVCSHISVINDTVSTILTLKLNNCWGLACPRKVNSHRCRSVKLFRAKVYSIYPKARHSELSSCILWVFMSKYCSTLTFWHVHLFLLLILVANSHTQDY